MVDLVIVSVILSGDFYFCNTQMKLREIRNNQSHPDTVKNVCFCLYFTHVLR